MPWSNLAGWGITGLILLALLRLLAPRPHGSVTFASSVYGVNCALPLGFCLLNHYWLAVWASAATAAAAWLVLGVLGGGAGLRGKRLREDVAQNGPAARLRAGER
jgi:hypothetical protein